MVKVGILITFENETLANKVRGFMLFLLSDKRVRHLIKDIKWYS